MQRQIKSEAELVNALCKGVGVEFLDDDPELYKMNDFLKDYHVYTNPHDELIDDINKGFYKYSEPVEVVELWGYLDDIDNWDFQMHNDTIRYCTHKQTQIHLNGAIIWTETEKV